MNNEKELPVVKILKNLDLGLIYMSNFYGQLESKTIWNPYLYTMNRK
jgi:hypothetical protein